MANELYSEFIFKSRYARWLEKEGRRENWNETVDRYIEFFSDRLGDSKEEIREAIVAMEVVPSMRCLMTAGPALARDNVAGYNCSYVAVDHPHVFDEIMYVLMCGTGVGFSVEREYVERLPTVAESHHSTDTTIIVPDSRLGWASSFRELINLLYSGRLPKWDLSRIRPGGAKLKTFGGRASGPAPLEDLFNFCTGVFRAAAGRRLTSLECHDIVCKTAEIVVVGGVRRSALLSLSNLTDDRMRKAKSGQWWEREGYRALANNSACYTSTPDVGAFLHEWTSLYESKSGERGIFSRGASQRQAARNGRRDPEFSFGTNPCSEIILRSKQFCNLSEVVVRAEDGFEDLKRKVRLATILGTVQSTLTDFRYLSKEWKRNTEEERLLGVSLTGIMDHPVLNGSFNSEHRVISWLKELRDVAISTNAEWADRLGIPRSTAITCVKPSGTVSQRVDSSSGIHARHNDYYIRTVRCDAKDPMAQFLVAQGFPAEEDVTNKHNLVFSFPIKAPDGAVLRNDRTAVQQLELWKVYQEHWCEHKPSITVSVRDNEWIDVAAWVYSNFDSLCGVSFLPNADHIYKQAPYQDITKEEYEVWMQRMPVSVDWGKLAEFEREDTTTASHEIACSGGQCEL